MTTTNKRLKKNISFSDHEKDIYDYLDKTNASALVKKLVREHMIIERLTKQGVLVSNNVINTGKLTVETDNNRKADNINVTNNNSSRSNGNNNIHGTDTSNNSGDVRDREDNTNNNSNRTDGNNSESTDVREKNQEELNKDGIRDLSHNGNSELESTEDDINKNMINELPF